jgi:hypothetical protein
MIVARTNDMTVSKIGAQIEIDAMIDEVTDVKTVGIAVTTVAISRV